MPNCKDQKLKSPFPGPGAYKNLESIEKRAEKISKMAMDSQMVGQEMAPFQTKTKRSDFWRNQMETPFTKQTYIQNPGPGAYKVEKKKDEIKSKIMMDEAVHAAFNSSEVRDTNKKIKSLNPGPGTYINIANPNHCSIKVTDKNLEDRSEQELQGIKLGPFGSNNQRFFNSWLKPKEGPDPGAYIGHLVKVQKAQKNKNDMAIEGKSTVSTRAFTAAEKERTKPNSVFMSTTERFNVLENNNPNVRLLQSEKAQRGLSEDSKFQVSLYKGQGNIVRAQDKVQYDFKDTRNQWTKKERAGDYEMFSGKNIGFDQTSPRLQYNQVFYGHSLKFEVPGPGQYQPNRISEIATTSQPKNKTRVLRLTRPGTFQQPRSKTLK